MNLCDENIRNQINPYTATGTFGVSWNGGYRPNQVIEYIRADENIVPPEPRDDFVPPPFTMPSNIFLKTQEARRFDILTGGEPTRIYEDRDCADPYNKIANPDPPSAIAVPDVPLVVVPSRLDQDSHKILIFTLLVLGTIFLVSLK